EVEIRTGRERIAMHGKAQRKHSVLTFPPHHQGIPLGARRAEGKTLIHLRQSARVVEKRSLAAYERVASGGGRCGLRSRGCRQQWRRWDWSGWEQSGAQ